MAKAQDAENFALILDASGSMNGKLAGGTRKIAAAKDAIADIAAKLPDAINVSLRAYGHQSHRSKKDCKDTAIISQFGAASDRRGDIISSSRGLKAQGYTPISYVLGLAADDLKPFAGKRTIILVSDGKETCEGDPCVLAGKLAAADADLVIHTVGFGVDDQTRRQLQCIANQARGEYRDANTAIDLVDSVAEVVVAEPKVETKSVTIKIKKKIPGILEILNSDYHNIHDAETGERVGNIGSSDNGKIELPAGIYNVKFGTDLFWKSVEVTGGETTTLKAGVLKINNSTYHHILDDETRQKYQTIGSGDEDVTLPPGTYAVSFDKAVWNNVVVNEGETTVLDPAVLVIENHSHHHVRDAEMGEHAATYSSNDKKVVLPPGGYSVMFGKTPWRVDLASGATTVLKPAILKVNNNQYHQVRDANGKASATYSTSTKQLPMVPGAYDVMFGKVPWRVELTEGETTMLNPGGLAVMPQTYLKIYDGEGKEAATNSSSDKRTMLPPGNYSVKVEDQEVPLEISEGTIINLNIE